MKVERRKFIRKPIRISCVVQFSSGISINGNTRNVSLEGVDVESVSGLRNKKIAPSVGDIGLLTLRFKKGSTVDIIQAQCRVIHMTGNGMGLSARFMELNKKDIETLGKMIASGKAQVESD